jgi:RNA polymerase sigma factor (sigma-70 family)
MRGLRDRADHLAVHEMRAKRHASSSGFRILVLYVAIISADEELSPFSRHYPVVTSFSMQDGVDASVLNSKVSRQNPVNETQDRDSQHEETDEQLMAAFARGSADAFAALFQRYKSPVFGFFCRRVEDRSRAEELTQDTFLALLRAAERYQPTALFRTWLYAVALNILRAHRRKALFRALFSGRATERNDPPAPVHFETELILREAVGKLEPADREVLLLREFEELNYAEIAIVLHIPINTVRSRLFRARTALRDLLAAPLPGDRELTRAEEHS